MVRPVDGLRGRVLVVDDEPALCVAIERILRAEFDVTTEASAADALARICAGERYDLILSDIMMPQMDGSQLHAAIREIDPAQAQRFAFLSASTPPNVIVGESSIPRLQKPVSLAVLIAFVRSRM